MRAWASPGCSSSETPSNARTGPNCLLTAWTCRAAVVTHASLVRVGQFGLGVLLGVFLVRDDRLLRNARAAVEGFQRLERQWAESRVGLDHPGDPAVEDALHGTLGAVDRNDLHVAGFLVGGLEGGHRAERHLVVLGVDRGDIGVGRDELLGDLLALLPGEVTGLLGDYLETG